MRCNVYSAQICHPWSCVKRVLRCVAVCCSVLQCVAVCCSCCNLLYRAVVCYSVCSMVLQRVAVAVWCAVLRCAAQYVAVQCCSAQAESIQLSLTQLSVAHRYEYQRCLSCTKVAQESTFTMFWHQNQLSQYFCTKIKSCTTINVHDIWVAQRLTFTVFISSLWIVPGCTRYLCESVYIIKAVFTIYSQYIRNVFDL